jgi:A/G-specific adenine glycosylase
MQAITEQLLKWYEENKILYPWRETKDPYKIWLSEILLQQTRIPVALPFFKKIVQKYPSIEDIAKDSQDSFVAEWSGIGYYSRARNMHACARELVSHHEKKFPSDFDQLLSLPGIGTYTAGAIRTLCFENLTPAIDGNIARVLSRITKNLHPPQSKEFRREIEKVFMEIGEGAAPYDYFQSLMELGEQVCLPRPLCSACPVQKFCGAYSAGMENRVPQRRARKAAVPFFWYFLILEKSNSLFFMQNSARPFLRDAWMFPDLLSTEELNDDQLKKEFKKRLNIEINKMYYLGSKSHSVTYRRIRAVAFRANDFKFHKPSGRWIVSEELDRLHTSSVIKKILDLL